MNQRLPKKKHTPSIFNPCYTLAHRDGQHQEEDGEAGQRNCRRRGQN